jgi:hypothetical protein
MGTRADYYIGIGPTAEWLGSTTWDGYPDGIPADIFKAKDDESFRKAVADVFANNAHTLPAEGWPWPWGDSRTTDYAYAWVDGGVKLSSFGRRWESLAEHDARCQREEYDVPKLRDDEVRDMSALTADTATIMAKSGLMILRGS